MHLSSEGKLYLDYAQKIVNLDESLTLELRRIRDLDSGEVNIGITTALGTVYIPRLLPKLQKRYPGIRIKLTETSAVMLEDMIYDRQVDFAIINYPFKSRQFCHEVLFQQEIVVTLPTADPVCCKAVAIPEKKIKWLDIKYLKDRTFILEKQGQRLRLAADELFSRAGIKPIVLLETGNAITAFVMAEAGIGIAITIPELLKSLPHSKLNVYSIGKPPMIYTTVVAYVSKETLSISAQALIEGIKKSFPLS
jgi:DNA-binding transcriptional LysR family regulator